MCTRITCRRRSSTALDLILQIHLTGVKHRTNLHFKLLLQVFNKFVFHCCVEDVCLYSATIKFWIGCSTFWTATVKFFRGPCIKVSFISLWNIPFFADHSAFIIRFMFSHPFNTKKIQLFSSDIFTNNSIHNSNIIRSVIYGGHPSLYWCVK